MGILGITEKSCKKQKVDDVEVNQIISGGGSYTFNLPRYALANSKKIKLYAVRGSTPLTITDLSKIADQELEYSKTIRKPELE